MAGLALPITTVLSGAGQVSGLQAVVCAALVVGSGAASTALWFYSRRYVGELSLLRPWGAGGASERSGGGGDSGGEQVAAAAAAAAAGEPLVRLSVLDFWGNREVGVRGAGRKRARLLPDGTVP